MEWVNPAEQQACTNSRTVPIGQLAGSSWWPPHREVTLPLLDSWALRVETSAWRLSRSRGGLLHSTYFRKKIGTRTSPFPAPDPPANPTSSAAAPPRQHHVNRNQKNKKRTIRWDGAKMSFICHIHNYTEYNEQWNVFSAFNPSKYTHTWSSGQLTLQASGEQLGVRCLAQGSHLSRGQFLPEPRFEPTTSGSKSNALSIRPRLPLPINKMYLMENTLDNIQLKLLIKVQ